MGKGKKENLILVKEGHKTLVSFMLITIARGMKYFRVWSTDQEQWSTPVIPLLRNGNQEVLKVEASLGNTASPHHTSK